MCISRTYWAKKGIHKECGTFTVEETHEAYKSAYSQHRTKQWPDHDQFIQNFPRERAMMTLEETEAFFGARST